MKILILETSSEKGCLVFADQAKPLQTVQLPGGPELSKTLASQVHKLIASTCQPQLIAVGTGPGSYTGIRVGTALAQALAYGWNIPLLGFCSLEAFGPPPVLVDARRGGFYALTEGPAFLARPENLRLQHLSSIRTPHPELIRKRLLSDTMLIEADPDPDWMARVVWEQFVKEGVQPIRLNYLSDP